MTTLLMIIVTLVFVFTEEVQRLHRVVFRHLISGSYYYMYACGIWACHFCKHLKFSTMRCRKCNFVLIDAEVRILLTFFASMKAKLCLYQKYVSVFLCLHVRY